MRKIIIAFMLVAVLTLTACSDSSDKYIGGAEAYVVDAVGNIVHIGSIDYYTDDEDVWDCEYYDLEGNVESDDVQVCIDIENVRYLDQGWIEAGSYWGIIEVDGIEILLQYYDLVLSD